MVRKAVYLGVFVAAFLIGLTVALPLLSSFEVIPVDEIVEVEITPAHVASKAVAEQTQPEKLDWKQEDETKFKIKLQETGEGFHGDEVIAKHGERWLGLFKDGNRFVLRDAKIEIDRVHDPITDENENIKTGKSVFTKPDGTAVFLLKDADTLKKGPIETKFYSIDYTEQTQLKNGTQKEFEFNGHHYTLRVENELTTDEFLAEGTKLVLIKNGTEQVLNYLDYGCEDCGWNLFWVGDLDQDGELDFYFDLSGHYNVIDKRLFLSSQARKGQIVRNVASFRLTGC